MGRLVLTVPGNKEKITLRIRESTASRLSVVFNVPLFSRYQSLEEPLYQTPSSADFLPKEQLYDERQNYCSDGYDILPQISHTLNLVLQES